MTADEMSDNIANDAALYLKAVSYFPQLSADDVDAIAEQIGGLSVDEVAAELETLFAAQLDAEAETTRRRTANELTNDIVNDAFEAYSYFPQVEDEKIDAIADQIGELKLDELFKEAESLLAAQLDAEAQNQRTSAGLIHPYTLYKMAKDGKRAYNYAYGLAQAEAEAEASDFFDDAFDMVGDFVEENALDFADQLAGAAKQVAVGKA